MITASWGARQAAAGAAYEHVAPSVVLSRPGMLAVAVFRLAQALHRLGLGGFGRVVAMLNVVLFGCEIPAATQVGDGLVVHHPMGVVIHGAASVGRNLRIHTGAVIGVRAGRSRDLCAPRIGDDVLIGAGAKVIGPITIGDRVQIGANAVVLTDVPDDAYAVGNPARIESRTASPDVSN